MPSDLSRLKEMSGLVSVVGIVDTDYGAAYRKESGNVAPDAYYLGASALLAALDDASLDMDEIDGLVVGITTAYDRMGEVLGVNPRWGLQADVNTGIQGAVQAIHSGMATCVALVYGNNQRSAKVAYGGPAAAMATDHMAYTYYAPWGFTSQGGIYAMLTQRLFSLGWLSPATLGTVAIAQREFATGNPRAVMQAPLNGDGYLASRFIAEPLRLFDYCLVNDGGVALILKRSDLVVNSGPRVVISGIARSDINKGANSLRPRLEDLFRTPYSHVAEDVFAVSGLDVGDLSALQIYDSFSTHVLLALTGLGICESSELDHYLASGQHAIGGRLPVNTSGGHLSESYMQGWNHQVEAIRQLRGTSGVRQIQSARHVLYASGGAGIGAGIMYSVRG